MADKETLERVREFFEGDRYAMDTGVFIEEIDELLKA